MFDYDKALQDETSHVLPNIHEHVGLDDYGEEALLDWQGKRIDPEDTVFIVKFKKNIGTLIPHTLTSDEFLTTELACEDNLIELLNEKDKDLYWGMEITTGKGLM